MLKLNVLNLGLGEKLAKLFFSKSSCLCQSSDFFQLKPKDAQNKVLHFRQREI